MADMLDLFLYLVVSVHVICCPFSKVEESFNLQATHDILFHRLNLTEYDHLEFPGVVPRSFLGPLSIAAVSSPLVYLSQYLGYSKLIAQYIVRLVLGVVTVTSFVQFRQAVTQTLGPVVSSFLVLVTSTQFHFAFYISRTLPNIYALVLVLLAYRFWILQRPGQFIWCSAAAIIIFRSELSILLGLMLLMELVAGRISLTTTIKHCLLAGPCFLGLTVAVDSVMWRRTLWPEGVVLYYNTLMNKSSNWGTSPFLWYFYSAIPRAMLLALPLVPLGAWRDRRVQSLISPALGFVLLYSFLPHKEFRFIIYVFPLFNTAAAAGINFICQNCHKWRPMVGLSLALSMLISLLINPLISAGFLYVSHNNYPGGVAFQKLHSLVEEYEGPGNVHICNAAAQSGVSRFGELYPSWRYSKEEGLVDGSEKLMEFSHLLTEAPCLDSVYNETHELLAEVKGFSRLDIQWTSFPPQVEPVIEPKLCIFQRTDWEM